MSKKHAAEAVTSETITSDSDHEELPNVPNLEAQVDDMSEEHGFEFDETLIPGYVEQLVELAPDFVRPEGFLVVPRLNKKTGEIYPMTTTFAGILHDVVPWTDNRKKERVWFACEATAPTGALFTGRDEGNKEFVKKVVQGTRVGISGSGAINALKTKKGHFIYLHWTGNKVTTKNGDMWEVLARVSDRPVVEVK